MADDKVYYEYEPEEVARKQKAQKAVDPGFVTDKDFTHFLSVGASIVDDLVLYYHEGMAKGFTALEIASLGMNDPNRLDDLKKGWRKVLLQPKRELTPEDRTDYPNEFSDKSALKALTVADISPARKEDRILMPRTSITEYDHHWVVKLPVLNLETDLVVATRAWTLLAEMKEGNMNLRVSAFYDAIAEVHSRIPRFNPRYKTYAPDKRIFKSIETLNARVKGRMYRLMEELGGALVDITERYALSSGTLAGQVGRLKAGRAIALRRREIEMLSLTDSARLLSSSGRWTQETAWNELLRRTIPFHVLPEEMAFFTTNLIVMEVYIRSLAELDISYNSSTINGNASAGPLFPRKQRWQTTVSDLIIGSQFVAEHPLPSEEDARNQLHALWEKYDWASIVFMKNKKEIFDREKIETKSRNYFAFSTAAQIPAQLFYKNLYKDTHKCAARPTSWSLMGWSPWKGGVADLINVMSVNAKKKAAKFGFGWDWAVYSDNLFLLLVFDDEAFFISYDASSMESTITRADVKSMALRAVEQHWGGRVHRRMKSYIVNTHPRLSVDVVAVLGGLQVTVLGMGSGTAATAYANNEKMGSVALHADVAIRQLKGASKDEVLRFTGGGREVAAEATGIVALFSSQGVTLKVERVTEVSDVILSLNKFDVPSRFFELDLLGMSVVVKPELDLLDKKYAGPYPVLERARLLKSYVYNKLDHKGDLTDDEKSVLKVAREKMFYLLGGWADPALAILLRHRISSMAHETVPHEQLLEWLADDMDPLVGEASRGEIREMLQAPGVPAVYDVVKLCKGTVAAQRHVLALVGRGDFVGALKYCGPSRPERWKAPLRMLDDLPEDHAVHARIGQYEQFLRDQGLLDLDVVEVGTVVGGGDHPIWAFDEAFLGELALPEVDILTPAAGPSNQTWSEQVLGSQGDDIPERQLPPQRDPHRPLYWVKDPRVSTDIQRFMRKVTHRLERLSTDELKEIITTDDLIEQLTVARITFFPPDVRASRGAYLWVTREAAREYESREGAAP